MIRGKKVLALVLSVAMAATAFVGCGKKEDDKKSGKTADGKEQVSLKVWCSADDQAFMKKMGDKFNKENKKYSVKFTYGTVGEDKAKEQITKDPKSIADVFLFASDQIRDLASGGYLRDLSILDQAGLKVDGVFEEQALKSGKYEDKLYGLPYTNNMLFLYYNKSLLTPDEVKSLETIMGKQTAEGVKNFGVDVSNGFYNNMFFSANGCKLYGADGTDSTNVEWNTPAGVEVVKYLNTLVKNGKFHKPANNDHETLLKEGKLASYVGGGWDAAKMKEVLGENYAATILPTINIGGADKALKPFAAFKLVGVNKLTENAEAACTFAHFLTSKEVQELRYQERGYAPTATELLAQTFEDPAILASIEQAKATNSVLTPTAENFGNFWDPAAAIGDEIWKGELKDDAAIKTSLDKAVTSMTAKVQ